MTIDIDPEVFSEMEDARQEQIIVKVAEAHYELRERLGNLYLLRGLSQLRRAYPEAKTVRFSVGEGDDGGTVVEIREILAAPRDQLYDFRYATKNDNSIIAPAEELLATAADHGVTIGYTYFTNVVYL